MAKYGFDWAGDYYDSVRDHIHALGVVAATYNRLEFTFFMLFLHYYRHRDKAASLFGQFKNNYRIDTLIAAIEASESDKNVEDRMRWFLHCFEICADNRNTLMHSEVHDVELSPTTREFVRLRKSTKQDPRNFLSGELTLTQIRNAADEMWLMDHYGIDMIFWLEYRSGKIKSGDPVFDLVPKSLPQKPDEPNRLILPRQKDGQA